MAEPFNVPFALRFSRGAAFIAVVQAAHLRKRDDLPSGHHPSRQGSVLGQSQVRSGSVIIVDVTLIDSEGAVDRGLRRGPGIPVESSRSAFPRMHSAKDSGVQSPLPLSLMIGFDSETRCHRSSRASRII